MNAKLSGALQECVQALEAGMTLDECLNRYPSLASDLRPLLESALAARVLSQLAVPGNAVTRGRARLLSHAAQMREVNRQRVHLPGVWRLAVASVAVLVVLVFTSNGFIAASANALPGDPLYSVKRTVEDARLRLASNPQEIAQIQEEISKRRVEETESLLSEQRTEDVEFEGVVSEQLSDGWRIAGIPVLLADQTEVQGAISVGVMVEVRGQTQPDGSLLAERIRVEQPGDGGQDEGSTPNESTNQGEETPRPERTGDSSGHGSGSGEAGGDNSGSGSGEHTNTPEPTEQDDD